MNSLHFEVLSEAFASHGLSLPKDIYFQRILLFVERPRRPKRLLLDHIERAFASVYPVVYCRMPTIITKHNYVSTPRMMEGRAKGWPIGHARLHETTQMFQLRYEIMDLGKMFEGGIIPSVANRITRLLRRVHIELQSAFFGSESPQIALDRSVRHCKRSKLLISKAILHHWPVRHARVWHRFEEPRYKILGAIRQYKRIGDLRPSFVKAWEKGRKQRRRLKQQLTQRFHK